jgi:biopolymer transport protein ExbB/TolQ/biopolymer transport protein ExbD
MFFWLFYHQLTFYNHIGHVHPEKFLLRMKQLIAEGKGPNALSICRTGGERGLPQIVKAALQQPKLPPEMIRSNVEEAVVSLSSKVERRIGFFAVIGNISTLIGLMGTIYGLVLAFAAVGKPGVPDAIKTSMLASGISTAMNTTLFGLTIAVPCLWTFSYFQNRSVKLVESFDRQAISILNCIFTQDTKLKNYKPSERRRKKGEDTNLDITPIMGLMVVLIPLLLSSAEFVKLGRIEMNLPKSGRGRTSEPLAEEKPKNLNLGLLILEKGIYVKSSFSIIESEEVQEESTENKQPDIGLKKSDFDYQKLASKLKEVKEQVLKSILSDYHSPAEVESASLFQLSKWMENINSESLSHYKDYEKIKIVASNKMGFQKIINIMDASRDITIEGIKIPLFPSVSIGAGI